MRILSRFTGLIIFESTHKTIKETVLDAIKTKADLSEADLSEANLFKADLSGADLSGADLSEANLFKADLSGADLSGADLSGADLSGADLSGADLSEADLSEADLSGADLSGADLSEANLSGANGIISMQFFGFNIYVQKDKIKIGCKYMTVSDWRKVTVDEAVKMGIKKEHYESYKILCEAAISVL